MWYDKYISIYNQSPKNIPQSILTDIANGYQQINSNEPIVSVVAIAHNEEKRILSCLWSLIDNKNKYPAEIIVVNNNSNDGTAQLLYSLNITTIFEERPSPGYARQAGLKFAKGKYHICIDADTLYPPHYIETMTEALQSDKYSCAYGLWSFIPDEQLSISQIYCYEMLRDIYLYFQHLKRPELNVRGMVFAFRTELGRKYGFRTDIIRGEDGSLALNLKQDGEIRFVRSRKARPITDNSILKARGTMKDAVLFRLKKGLKGLGSLFYKKEQYQDKEDNLIQPKN